MLGVPPVCNGLHPVGLGALVSSLRAPFEPEAGAYAPGHQHPGDGSGARIHLMAGQ